MESSSTGTSKKKEGVGYNTKRKKREKKCENLQSNVNA